MGAPSADQGVYHRTSGQAGGFSAASQEVRGSPSWAREDSNLHELNAHWVLNPARLPIPPLAQAAI